MHLRIVLLGVTVIDITADDGEEPDDDGDLSLGGTTTSDRIGFEPPRLMDWQRPEMDDE